MTWKPRFFIPTFLLVACAGADGPALPSISALMHKQYTVYRAPFKIFKAESQAKAPDWAQLQEASTKFQNLATTLAKKTPNHGSDQSWRTLIDQHLADAKAIDDAIQARDVALLGAAQRRLANACTKCHNAHRPGRGQ
jgi:cytochrome c556